LSYFSVLVFLLPPLEIFLPTPLTILTEYHEEFIKLFMHLIQ